MSSDLHGIFLVELQQRELFISMATFIILSIRIYGVVHGTWQKLKENGSVRVRETERGWR